MTNTEELVVAAKGGDAAAFTRLIDAEARWAYGTARAIVGVGGEADDVFQDACLRAWRDLPTLRRPEMWTVWFRRIVTHAALDRARARRRLAQLPFPLSGQQSDLADQVADRDRMRRSLLRLAPDERALLVMRFGHDLELAEIARLLDQRIGTTKSKLHRSLRKLRKIEGSER